VLPLDNILGSAIKELRKSKKMTQQELSKLTGLKQNTISNHENGKRQLDEIDIRTYAKALGVSPQTLFNRAKQDFNSVLNDVKEKKSQIQSIYDELSDYNKPKLINYGNELLDSQKLGTVVDDNVTSIDEYRKRVSLPVPGKVSAGTGYWQEDDYDTMVDFYEDEIPDKSEYDTIAIVVGHSMEPKIKNGDFLFIKLKNQVDLNKIGIFKVDGENYVKKLKSDRLESLNKDYDDIQLSEENDIRTIGEVVDVYREC
jgi:phage repressor protein C with HTH and peptisase S24 domain